MLIRLDRMPGLRAVAWSLALWAGLSTPGSAQTERFVFPLSGQSVVPPTDSPAVGSADFLLDLPTVGFSGYIDFGALRGTVTNVRICGPAGPGVTAPVLFNLGRTRHVLLSGLSRSQVQDLQREFWYLEVCTNAYPEGEVRGQIVHGGTANGGLTWTAIKSLYR